MLGDSSGVLAPPPLTSGGENQPPLTATTSHHDGLEDKAGDRSNYGGHRWPRQETLALLRIRSDMDLAFREASAKGPLWDEVSRKLAELGYNRSGKKCKEKFENVYKYHKRTKEGRSAKSETKAYRFFDQLQVLENHQSKPRIPESPMSVTNIPPLISQITVPSTTHVSANQATNFTNITSFLPANPPLAPPPMNPLETNVAASFPNISGDLISNSTSSSTSSDVELEGRRGNRKRKWTDFFERLMKGVMEKQEELQKKFLEALDKREQERLVREEAWRLQEMARINREREILAHERSIAASKDAAVMSFLQKIAKQQEQIPGQPQSTQPAPLPVPMPAPPPVALPIVPNRETSRRDNNGESNFVPTSSSRWPKVEVDALIGIRTSLDSKYQDNGPKGPLWEEISAEMRKIGYNRSSKRCKEKWENINKYFKKVKDSNKRRPEDSKTCPYFSQLDALYREKKNKSQVVDHNLSNDQSGTMPQNAVPLMVLPEQQWPPPPQQDLVTEDAESDQNQDEEDDENEADDGGDHFRICSQ
ncbi:trihelix transcription factor GT-2-like [Tripterygium wilfordii]|uniref:Trihelix transcription factor GT-2-like n=1 Tax=Tripterygium wilfordii TaxID=458696 RepID=A0A7J7CN51_TRIWF|nr:trihelix transcription factor GT-2-like [Tripterygium wilfordii]KAF5735356.1 trihelix transcription factor GT-2-like [Tripterygium wilfordii]